MNAAQFPDASDRAAELLLADLDQPDRLGERLGPTSFARQQCVREVRTWTGGAQLHCRTHDAWGPVRPSCPEALIDLCPILAARAASQAAWMAGVVARHGCQCPAPASPVSSGTDSEKPGESEARR